MPAHPAPTPGLASRARPLEGDQAVALDGQQLVEQTEDPLAGVDGDRYDGEVL